MRFHLVDRIDAWEAHRYVSGRKATSRSEPVWRHDGHGRVWMAPELVLESICQAAAALILLSTEYRRRAVLLAIGELDIGEEVTPGDVVHVEATIGAATDEAATVDGRASVAGDPVLTVSGLICGLVDAETFDTAENTRQMARRLLREDGPR